MADTRFTKRCSLYGCLFLTLSIQVGCTVAVGNQGRQICQKQGTSVLVRGDLSTLFLCEKGQGKKAYPVAFGSGGLGKERVGDRKTPVGRFKLRRPRPSVSGFKTFIGIVLPRKVGIAVGIHGPTRKTRWLGSANTLVDWTAGCIAVSSDAEIDEIATFVRKNPRARIHITRDAMEATNAKR